MAALDADKYLDQLDAAQQALNVDACTHDPDSIDERSGAAQWNALELGGNPFVRHEFLLALERTGCVGGGYRLDARIICCCKTASGEIEAALPLYSKSAFVGRVRLRLELGARVRAGGPALLPEARQHAAVHAGDWPSPAASHDADARTRLRRQLIERAARHAQASAVVGASVCSSPTTDRAALERRAAFCWRKDCQFHWHNRGYRELRRLPGDVSRRQAQESAARAAARAGEPASASARCPARRWTRGCGTSCSDFPPARSQRAATSTTSTWSSSARCRRRCRARSW